MMLSRERKEGRLEGRKDEKYSIAKNLKKEGLDIEFISKNTGLTIEEINNLKIDG